MSVTYIFGYGSLISSESRARTGYSGEAIPCVVKGVQRAWNLLVSEYGMTAVGVVFNHEAKCNGVVVPIQEGELPKFDERESGYHRFKIDKTGIVVLNNQEVPARDIWTYVPDETGIPSLENPIAQSYVDVILSACFDYGEDYVRQFIINTVGWNHPWINDRKNPRYARAMNEVPKAHQIDILLEQVLPDEFARRKENKP